MKDKHILETIGFGFLIIGGLSFLSEEFYPLESLTEIYSYNNYILFSGFVLHLIGGYQKEKAEKNKS